MKTDENPGSSSFCKSSKRSLLLTSSFLSWPWRAQRLCSASTEKQALGQRSEATTVSSGNFSSKRKLMTYEKEVIR